MTLCERAIYVKALANGFLSGTNKLSWRDQDSYQLSENVARPISLIGRNERDRRPGFMALHARLLSLAALYLLGLFLPEIVEAGGASFQTRCSAPGVIICKGFDAIADVPQGAYPGTGLYPDTSGFFRGTWDSTQHASGAGSLRFEIPSGSSPNSAGYWREVFNQSFGEGRTFFVQFRQRFSTEMTSLGNAFGGSGWKQAIFHNTDGLCTEVQLTTANINYGNVAQMYAGCASSLLLSYNTSISTIFQYSTAYPPGSSAGAVYCQSSLSVTDPGNKCVPYKPDQWMTFYFEITIGTWGGANSIVRAWVGYEDEDLRQVVNRNDVRLVQDMPGREFNCLTLTPYDPGKDGRSHPTAYTWYDELIISSSPIAPPLFGSGDTSPPSSPANLNVR